MIGKDSNDKKTNSFEVSNVESNETSRKKPKLRIMHISDNVLPTLGGLERAVDTISNSWADDGHEVFVVSSEKSSLPKTEKVRENLTVFRLPLLTARVPSAYKDQNRVFFPPAKDPLFATEFKKILKTVKPDIAHVHGWVLHSVIKALTSEGVPVISSAHDFGQVCAKKILVNEKGEVCDGPGLRKCLTCSLDNYGIKGIPITLALRRAGKNQLLLSKELAISSAVANAKSAVKEKYQKDMTVLPTFISDELLQKASNQPKPNWLPSSPYLLYVGVVHQSKGVQTLIDAYKSISDDIIGDIKLLIVGEPNKQTKIELSPGVILVGKKNHNEILGAMQRSLITIVPSITPEGLSQTAVEALAASAPLIVSNHGGLLDVVDNGRFALTFTPGDSQDLAAKISDLLRDPIKREKLSQAGPAQAGKFTLKEVKPRLLEMYYKAIEENSKRRLSQSFSPREDLGDDLLQMGL